MNDLENVKGVTSKVFKLLSLNGISTAEMLGMSNFREVCEIDGIGESTAKKIIRNARVALKMTKFTRVSQLQMNKEKLTTGSENLDGILKGGVETGRLTEAYGAFKSGKSTVAHTLAVTVQLPKDQGGLNGLCA